MKIVLKITFSLLVAIIILLPAMVLFTPKAAKAENDTNIMTRCWTEKECEATADADVGWEWGNKSPEAIKNCGSVATGRDNLGFCYAVNLKPIELQVKIPTTSGGLLGEVSGFAQYLSEFYKFFMAALAVMAVVMIMWAGFKRILAAGRADAIKDANEAFFSAIVGLVIALLSYSLLSLVNPKLVEITELRIPKIKMQTFGNWCPAEGDEVYILCGAKGTHPLTNKGCTGQTCDVDDGICTYSSALENKPVCIKVIATGHIKFVENAYVDAMWLGAVCRSDNKYKRLKWPTTAPDDDVVSNSLYHNLNEQETLYVLGKDRQDGGLYYGSNENLHKAAVAACGAGTLAEDTSPVRGFVLEVEVNDDKGWFATDDDSFAVGRGCKPVSPLLPSKIKWEYVEEASLFQFEDFPIAPKGIELRRCEGRIDKKICNSDTDCKNVGKCGALKSSVSCEIDINRSDYRDR